MLARVIVLLPDIHDGGSVVSLRRPHVAFSYASSRLWKGEIDNATGQLSKRNGHRAGSGALVYGCIVGHIDCSGAHASVWAVVVGGLGAERVLMWP